MGRGLTSSQLNDLSQQNHFVIDLIKIQLPLLTVRYTNAVVDYTYNAETYLSAQGYVGHTDITEATSADNESISLLFDGVDTTISSLVLNQNFVGSQVNIFKAILDDTFTGTAFEIYKGQLESFNLVQEQDTIKLQFNCAGPFADFQKTAIYGSATQASYQSVHPNDQGFEFVAATKTDLKWGSS